MGEGDSIQIWVYLSPPGKLGSPKLEVLRYVGREVGEGAPSLPAVSPSNLWAVFCSSDGLMGG